MPRPSSEPEATTEIVETMKPTQMMRRADVPMAMVSASLVATALFSLVPLLWQKAEKVERADIRKLIGAALLIGVLRKVFIMYGLSMTSPIDGSIIDTIVPLLVLALSVLLGMDRFTRLKITGLVRGMA